MNMVVSIIVNAIRMGTIFLYGCLGEILMEKAGHLNLGIPGIMCIGAAGGGFGVYLCCNHPNMPGFIVVLLAILFSLVFSALSGLIYAFLTVTMKANQNVTGLALTTFGVGFMKFFAKRIYDQEKFVELSNKFINLFGLAKNKNPFIQIFLSHGILVYLSIILAILATYVLKRTKTGLYLRSIGENPATADAAGINVSAYKYAFILIGSAIAGLGGLYYVMDKTGGTTFAEAAIDGFGWMAVALVIASMWKPLLAIAGSIVFGGLSILDAQLTTLSLSQQKLFAIVPYLITIIILVVTSIMKNKNAQAPAALGLNYYREDR